MCCGHWWKRQCDKTPYKKALGVSSARGRKKKRKEKKGRKKDWQKKRLDEVAGTAGGNLKSVYIRAGCS